MVDWTIIATTAIATTSGLVGAALGFLGARTQATSDVRKLQLQQREERVDSTNDLPGTLDEARTDFINLRQARKRILNLRTS